MKSSVQMTERLNAGEQYLADRRRGKQESPVFYSYLPIYCYIEKYFPISVQRPHRSYPKVGRSKPVGGGRRGRGGRGGVREVSVDVSQQVAHHGWHTRTHVLSRQTREMPTERRTKAHVS